MVHKDDDKIKSTGLRQNIGTLTGRSGKINSLFPYYDILASL
jgi:hypothetical protein